MLDLVTIWTHGILYYKYINLCASLAIWTNGNFLWFGIPPPIFKCKGVCDLSISFLPNRKPTPTKYYTAPFCNIVSHVSTPLEVFILLLCNAMVPSETDLLEESQQELIDDIVSEDLYHS